MTALAPHLSAYLREHLPRERAVSPHTVKTENGGAIFDHGSGGIVLLRAA